VNVRFGVFAFDVARRQLLRNGEEVHLTPKAFDLLALLIQRAPAVAPKAEIHTHLWPGTFVADATLAGLVKEVRRALGDDRAGAIIRTAHRVGFAFSASTDASVPEQASAVTHWLIARSRNFPLHDGANVIGRDPGAAVWLDVPGVSRRHAQVIVEGDTAVLEDLGSKNGTLVADRPVRGRITLRNADRIQIATELLVFQSSTSGISTATQPASPAAKADDGR
jgi:DNA-binding winged helix-turn-helix (wHTH) protein